MPEKRDLALLFGVRLLSAMGVTLILPVMPAMARAFGLSIAEAGMVVVCFTLAEATMTPVAGVLSDRFGRMAVLLPALLVFAGGGILCLFAESWRDVLICRVIQGIGAGPLGVLYTILAADMVDEKHLPRIMGRLTAVSSLGTIVYPRYWRPSRRMVMAGPVFRLHAGPADSGFVPHGNAGKTAGGDGLAALLEANGEYPT